MFRLKISKIWARRPIRRVFWDKLIEIDDLQAEIEQYKLPRKEKTELLKVVYQTIDIRILDIVLSSLPKEKHQSFLDRLTKKPKHNKLLKFLKENVENIEDKIQNLAKEVKKEILEKLQEG